MAAWDQLNQSAHLLLREVNPLTRPVAPIVPVPTVSDVCGELAALECEFGGLKLEPNLIAVTTPPIELGGIELGRFEIQLIGKALKVVALDPHPAESDSDITHPHVSAGQLCAGWGAEPMAAALTEGRLLDFFMIVRQVLQNYSPDSPYVSLDDWYGRQCDDCDATMTRDESSSCESCGRQLCDYCQWSCTGCHYPYCQEHSSSCETCGDRVCGECGCVCEPCGNLFCKNCCQGDQCNACRDEEANAGADQAAEGTAEAAAHALSVGEAGVLA
jgi:hypothetical protein